MLTDSAVRASKPRDKAYRLTDGGGLFLHVVPNGRRFWRLRYEFAGKEKLLSFGPYPQVSLADARAQRDEAKSTLRRGRDPSVLKRIQTASVGDHSNTFEAVVRDWHGRQLPSWTPRHAEDVLDSLRREVFPTLGAIPIKEITPPMVLKVIRGIEAKPALETARRVRQRMSAVFVYAIAVGIGETDPAAIIRGAMAPITKGRQPAVLELEEAREVLRQAESEVAHPATKLALRLLALTSVRPGEIRGAAWQEFEAVDTDVAVWRIPADRMKMKREHVVPLSRQAVEVLEVMRPLTGRGPLVFPNARNAHRPMSENAIGYLLNRAGYHSRHVPHGWRATFSTIMNERHRVDRHVIDLMLAHAAKDKTEGAYNRAAHMPRRRELAQEWADLLLQGRQTASIVASGRRR